MNTSYFSKYKGSNGVAISLYVPAWYNGRSCSLLAPSKSILFEYRDVPNTERYIRRYYEEILDLLCPQDVYNFLGDDAVLLCYEKSGSFCHRYLVARWLVNNLNIPVITEL